MTTNELVYSTLSKDAQLISLWGGKAQIFLNAAPQNISSGGNEFSYTVYRDLPVSQFYVLESDSESGLTVRRIAFETFCSDRATPPTAGADLANAIAFRIKTVLKSIVQPGGIGAVYPEGILTHFTMEERSNMAAQQIVIHSYLT